MQAGTIIEVHTPFVVKRGRDEFQTLEVGTRGTIASWPVAQWDEQYAHVAFPGMSLSIKPNDLETFASPLS